MNIDDGTCLAARPDQMSCQVDGKVVILNKLNGTVYSANKLGMRIWEILQSGTTFGALCETIVNEFDVTSDVAAHDVADFVAELDRNQLILTGPLGGAV